MEKMNPKTHYYLYAKGHYKETNLIEDLKTIQSNYCGFKKIHISTQNIIDMLLPITYKAIQDTENPEYFFCEFVVDITNPIFIKQYNKDNNYKLIRGCLKILRFTKIADLNLGKADKNILPLSRMGEKYSRQ